MNIKNLETTATLIDAAGVGRAHPKSIAAIIAIHKLVEEKGEDITIRELKQLSNKVNEQFEEAERLAQVTDSPEGVEEKVEAALKEETVAE